MAPTFSTHAETRPVAASAVAYSTAGFFTRLIAPTAAGSLQIGVKPGDFVVVDQFVDRTYGRPQTFYDGPDFVSLARAARARKFGPELPKDWKERSRQARFLQYRGFSTDHIRAVLDGEPDPT